MFTFNFLFNMEEAIKAERKTILDKIVERKREELKSSNPKMSSKYVEFASSFGKDAERKVKKYSEFVKTDSFPSNFYIFSIIYTGYTGSSSPIETKTIGIYTTFEKAYQQILKDIEEVKRIWEKDESNCINFRILTEIEENPDKRFKISLYAKSEYSCTKLSDYIISSNFFYLDPRDKFITVNTNDKERNRQVYEL